jgi:hypothetical protein
VYDHAAFVARHRSPNVHPLLDYILDRLGIVLRVGSYRLRGYTHTHIH